MGPQSTKMPNYLVTSAMRSSEAESIGVFDRSQKVQSKMTSYKKPNPLIESSDDNGVKTTVQNTNKRGETYQSTAFESTQSKGGNSAFMKTLGAAQLQNEILQAGNVSERDFNPYISSERLVKDHPLKFGLKKTSFNTHLSTKMETSPKIENLTQSPGAAFEEHMPTNLIIADADHNLMNGTKKKYALPNKKPTSGKFFGSTKVLRKSHQALTQDAVRMDFSVNGQAVPTIVAHYQNVTQQLARPFATYMQS